MNLNDFVVLPNSAAKSVKLNARNLQELKTETGSLAQESDEMEEKLKRLKERMSQEKEQLQPPPRSPATVGTRTTRRNRLKGTVCGQCEVRIAGVKCAECSEDYCFHSAVPIQVNLIPVHNCSSFLCFLTTWSTYLPVTLRMQILIVHGEEDGKADNEPSLLIGAYDEEESAKSFQEALRQWREAAPTPAQGPCGHRHALVNENEYLVIKVGSEVAFDNMTLANGDFVVELI
uniref:Uncharacterized protein n=1 Tax=Neogobius melanostomus TaxID=47308 RepID=A0A8C6WLL9_9GOBI